MARGQDIDQASAYAPLRKAETPGRPVGTPEWLARMTASPGRRSPESAAQSPAPFRGFRTCQRNAELCNITLLRPARDMLHISASIREETAMMPVVRIDDATFAGLSTLKTWLGTKTPSDTIERVVREAMEQLGLERDDEPAGEVAVTGEGAMEFTNAPGLTFTKPLAASVDGKAIKSPRWSSILFAMIAHLKASGLEGEKLASELNIPAKAGRYVGEGFRYQHKLGISLQGQSAAGAWKEVDRLAKKWGIPVRVEFWWRQNPKAQYPGRVGILRSGAVAG